MKKKIMKENHILKIEHMEVLITRNKALRQDQIILKKTLKIMASHMVLMKRDLMEVTKKSLRKITEKLDPMVLMEEIALKKNYDQGYSKTRWDSNQFQYKHDEFPEL